MIWNITFRRYISWLHYFIDACVGAVRFREEKKPFRKLLCFDNRKNQIPSTELENVAAILMPNLCNGQYSPAQCFQYHFA